MCVRSECVAAEIFPPSGKQLFERDRNLDTSDIQFLEDGNSPLSFGGVHSFSSSRERGRCWDRNADLLSSAAGNNVEVDESLFQDIEDLDLDEDDPDFDPLQMGSDED